jgi:hypothetical protein
MRKVVCAFLLDPLPRSCIGRFPAGSDIFAQKLDIELTAFGNGRGLVKNNWQPLYTLTLLSFKKIH